MAESKGGHEPGSHRFSVRELEAFAGVQRSHLWSRAVTTTARYFFATAIIGIIAWGVVNSLQALRGTTTGFWASVAWGKWKEGDSEKAEIVRQSFEGFSLVLNAVLVYLYRMSRKRQQETILQLGPFREMYESFIDPHRTTSGLSRGGQTPPEEK